MADDLKRQQVVPGECPPTGCPEPTRIECIVVDKVYDSCFQIEERTRATEIGNFSGPFDVGDTLSCALAAGEKISCMEVSRTAVGDGFFTITLLVTVPVTITNPNNPNQWVDREFTFTKTVTLCCPEGATPDCSESTLLFCSCVVTENNNGPSDFKPPPPQGSDIEVTCDFQICLVIKCILRVQLLVPSYGFCVPAPCVTLPGVCPPTPPAQCF
ncbi:MAG TPA: hypothetical protein GX711_05750 [Clostridia bacterium]|nr:hypothetical protein [Clostridia bacterium]